MLLETLDIRKNDVLIYSQNMFDFENNFKIIFKRAKTKKPKNISYFEVCEFVKDSTPKNLIVYRLLTNVKGMDAFSTKYGYFAKVNNNMELIYFDPVFALKDLKHLKFHLEPEEFRFKIQQVGLTSSSQTEDEAVYSEVYSFDMRAEEAKNQNDKIFADAIFIFDESYNNVDFKLVEKSVKEIDSSNSLKDEPVLKLKTVIDEKDGKRDDILKVNLDKHERILSVREEKINLLKQALGISNNQTKDDRLMNENLDEFNKVDQTESTTKHVSTGDKKVVNVLDLFKSAHNRQEESYILKIDDD